MKEWSTKVITIATITSSESDSFSLSTSSSHFMSKRYFSIFPWLSISIWARRMILLQNAQNKKLILATYHIINWKPMSNILLLFRVMLKKKWAINWKLIGAIWSISFQDKKSGSCFLKKSKGRFIILNYKEKILKNWGLL